MAAKRSGRGLTPDDLEVWNKVAKTVEKVDLPNFLIPTENASQKTSRIDRSAKQLRSFEFKPRNEPDISVQLAPHPGDVLKAAPRQMDRKNFDRLRKGKMVPDRRLDLHGMTADAAQAVLVRFLLAANAEGARLVLVITGKGRSYKDDNNDVMPNRRGIIRHSLPDWLRRPPLADKVVQAIPAHRKHGGEGAYYVYLRRKR